MRAAGYIRVSTQEQADKGWNLGEDRKLIEERCQDEGWDLIETYDDGGRQGDDPNRPGLGALLDSLGELDVVIMRSQDRISRDIGIWAVTSAALRAAGVRVETFTGPIDLESPAGEFMANVMASVGKFEKRQTGQRVKQAMKARARAGLHPGGAAPYGYCWTDEKTLAIVSAEAEVVERTFIDYCNGMSQRAIVRSLNDAKVPTQHDGRWQQSAINRLLSNVIYTGKLEFKGEVMAGAHEPIVSEELWTRAQTIRTGAHRRNGGRHPDGAHLLTRGILKCPECGSAMIPRKARPGVERERYICRGRVEHGSDFCAQPSIRRELIDVPFLQELQEGHFDLAATVKRIEERMAADLKLAREAHAAAESELARREEARARVERDYIDGKITADQWSRLQVKLTDELEGARRERERAQARVEEIEQAGVLRDAERVLLDRLDELERAVKDGVGAAPDLPALRNVIGQIFDSVQLVRCDKSPDGYVIEAPSSAAGTVLHPDWDQHLPTARDGEHHYLLWPTLRSEAVDGTFSPTGQEMPVGSMLQYPPSDPNPFLWRYCWW